MKSQTSLLLALTVNFFFSSCNNNRSSYIIDIQEHDNNLQETKDSIDKYISISSNKLPPYCNYRFGESYETIFKAEKKNNAKKIKKEKNLDRILTTLQDDGDIKYVIYSFLGNKLVSFGFFEESYSTNLSRNYNAFSAKCRFFTKQKGYCLQNQKTDKRKGDEKGYKNIDQAASKGDYIEYCLWKYDSFDFSIVFMNVNIGDKDILASIEQYQDVKAILRHYDPIIGSLVDSLRIKTKAKVIQVKPEQPIYLDEITSKPK